MTAVSLSFRDLLVIQGQDKWKPAAERIPVSDGVGEVVSIGPGVTRVKQGGHVAGIFLPKWIEGELTAETYTSPLGGASTDGVLAEYVVFSENAETINYRKYPDWDARALEITGGEGVDHVIEVVGGEKLNNSLNAVKVSGSISFIGLLAGLRAPINTFSSSTKT
jgi:NADPH:quinone reductase-like Zn-dependent oxidoreductase